MMQGVFIQSNEQQLLGAILAKYAIQRFNPSLHVEIIKVEEVPAFQKFVGSTYRPNYGTYTFDDLQSFTLTRFMPPELMQYEGRALVIDPDIFAVADITPLFSLDLKGAAIAACPKHNAFDTSVMLLDCDKLKHWSIDSILSEIKKDGSAYAAWMDLRNEKVHPLSRIWNSLDSLNAETKMLHTTVRLTQPWKTGLPIDFTFNPMPKLFGVIPRFWASYPKTYQPHPDAVVEKFFFTLAHDALKAGAVTESMLDTAISNQDIRSDFKAKIAAL
jgi:hypothetical protein